MNLAIEQRVASKLAEVPLAALEPFLSRLKEISAGRCDAVVAYGSCLSQVTRSGTSTPDFFLIVDRYRQFHGWGIHALLNCILPPSIYHFVVDGQIAKFNVISWKDLEHETSTCAWDVYHLGRFSKRIALAWAKDEASRKRMERIHGNAIRTAALRGLSLCPPTFELNTLIKEALKVSYYGELRVEADDKIERLLTAEKEYYRAVYSDVLETLTGPPWLLGKNPQTGHYQKPPETFASRFGRWKMRRLLSRSRLRAQLRWPKSIFTVDNWVDYLLAKIERTQGIRIQMTPFQKKFWFIYGWKHFFHLRKHNLIK